MKERPILFSAPMIQAILNGTKTQTRRVAKRTAAGHVKETGGHRRWHIADFDAYLACPYGQPGDRLWVRETWAAPHSEDGRPPRAIQCDQMRIHYLASESRGGLVWRPSIHMPRWSSRITLQVTAVRVERLQNISEADAMAEGVKNSLHLTGGRFARENFEHLWWTINGEGSWEANPWVWVVEFKRLEAA